MQTALGLAAAHAKGLVHRDIKPANIMLENGVERVRITDFGLARAVDDASITQNGVLTGTPQYMAPEQARGETVDQRADLFSLGSTLYAMCTGHSPFRADSTAAAVRQVCDTEPTPIHSINPDIPAWLEGIVKKLHAKEPSQRFESAAEVADLLEQCLAHMQQPDQHRLPRLAEELGRPLAKSRKPIRIRRRQVVTAALVLSVGLAALVWSHLPTWKRDQADSFNVESATIPSPIIPSVDEIHDQLNQMRGRLSGLQQSLSATSQDDEIGWDPNLGDVRLRATNLNRDFQPSEDSGVDTVNPELQSIRRRLELVKQNLGRPLE
jgi:serine/threonine-protein kinase